MAPQKVGGESRPGAETCVWSCVLVEAVHTESVAETTVRDFFPSRLLVISCRDFRSEGFQSLTTSSYKLYHIETPTGFRFVMTADPATVDLRDLLRRIYSDYFVDMVLKNPSYTPGQPFKSEAFGQAIDRFLRGLPFFS
jgi:hypothetical protein